MTTERFSGASLTCVRGERIVFQDLSFEVCKGDCVTLVGHNGSGKSSLLRMMAGLLRPFQGNLMWDGVSLDGRDEDHGSFLHYVGHHDAVKPTLTVSENILFWRDLHGGRGTHSVIDALKILKIDHLEMVHGRFLSAGQKRRTALSRLLVADAPLWLLDEPTTALDQETIQVLEGEIEKHRAQGGMVVLSTHSPLNLADQKVLDVSHFAPSAAYDPDALHEQTQKGTPE